MMCGSPPKAECWILGKIVALADGFVDEETSRSEVMYAVLLVLEAARDVANIDVGIPAAEVGDSTRF